MITKNTSKWFRGLAILMVLISHYAEWNEVVVSLEEIRVFASKLGIYGVNIFFLMSGYGLVMSTCGKVITIDFIKKRFLGAYLPYFVLIGGLLLIEGGFDSPKSILQFVVGYDYWFMMNLFIFYILFVIIWKINKAKSILITIGIIGYSVLLGVKGYNDFWIVSNFSFLIGIYTAMNEDKIGCLLRDNKSKLVLMFICLLLGGICVVCKKANPGITWQIVLCIFYTILIFIVSTMMNVKRGILLPVGTYSLYIYLLHSRIYFQIEPIFHKWGNIGKIPVIIGLTLLISIIIGHFFQYIIFRILKIESLRSK